MDRKQAGAVAAAIRVGHEDLTTKGDIAGLRWMVAINMAITLAVFAAVLQLLV